MITIAIPSRRILAAAIVSLTALVAASTVQAAVYVVPEAALTAPAVNAADIVTFDEVANLSVVNGLTIKGFTFSENTPSALTQPATAGPGNTNHVTGQTALIAGAGGGPSINPATYVLTIDMPGLTSSFGFGFVVSLFAPTPNVLTINLFDGATNVGSLSYDGVLDPTYAGGFAGIGSTIAFNSAQVTFGPSIVAYALDNVASVAAPVSAVPEPGSALVGMLALGLCGARLGRRARA